MNNSAIKIRMFGKFEIKVNEESVLEASLNSKKTSNLLAYLILNCHKQVSHTELFDLLWPNEESDNPGTALRTLLYRFRNNVEKSNISELENAIITYRGTYQWNLGIDCSIDVFDFSKLCEEASNIKLSVENRIKLYNEAIYLYTGNLLPNVSEEYWVVPKSVYYHDLYIKVVLDLIGLLKGLNRSEEIVDVCRSAMNFDLFDERIHLELILALSALGKNREALAQYNYTTDLYYKQLGIKPSEDICALYKKIINTEHKMEDDLEEIQNKIEGTDRHEGAFVCEYEIFKDIYQLQKRLIERNGGTFFIGLITINSTSSDNINASELDNVMEKILQISKQSLRKGDTIARFSKLQYVILLPCVSYEGGKKVMERIKRNYYTKYNDASTMLIYKIRPLC